MRCQLELIFQLVQGTQPDADAVLIEEGHLVHIRKLDAGHVGAHACGIQRSQQGVQAFQPLVRLLLNSAGGAAVGIPGERKILFLHRVQGRPEDPGEIYFRRIF